ncbi:hypothetical protein Q7612_06050 [Haemophilus influenzae]|uniref:hypothetical protein n=1 Tax=Haemophilus influenzae TaxID=727 RepID=UPI00313BA546
MIKVVQYLTKSIPNSSDIRKSWKVALGSLATQGSNTPLHVERHCPVPKGLRLVKPYKAKHIVSVERHCPVPKGLKLSFYFYLKIIAGFGIPQNLR